MPRYDYRCKAGHRYEKQEPFGSPTEHPCEKCGKLAQRQISAPTVIFKGDGWYKTDSRDAAGGRSRSKTPTSESGGDEGGKSGAKSEEKAKAKEASDTIDKKASKSKQAGSAAAD